MKLKKIPTLDDLVLSPRLTVPGKPESSVEYTFYQSGREFKGPPLIVAGAWDGEAAIKIASLGALVMIDPGPELFELLLDGPGDDEEIRNFIDHMVYPIIDGGDSLDGFMAIADALGEALAPRYVWVSMDHAPFPVSKRLREKYPRLTIIAGNYPSVFTAKRNEWADMVVMGHGMVTAGSEDMFGFRVDIEEIASNLSIPCWASALGLSKPADFVKSYAIGADFCVIDPGFTGYTFEELIGVIAAACFMLGADDPKDLIRAATVGLR